LAATVTMTDLPETENDMAIILVETLVRHVCARDAQRGIV